MMKYESARFDIKSGDILAFSHHGWDSLADVESQIVRMATRSEYSHVGVAWVFGGRVFIMEAVVPEVRIFPLSNLGDFYLIPCKELSTAAENEAFRLIGQKYSKWEAIKGFFGLTSADERWQCAEYVRSVCAANGLMLPGIATPTSVVHDLLDMGHELKLVTK